MRQRWHSCFARRMVYVALVLTLAALPTASHAEGGLVEQPVRIVPIGFAGPLSEINARSGRNAAILAIEEVNKSSPRINGQSVFFELMEQDDKADPRITEYIARYFVNSKAIGVVGHWTSNATVTAAPIYNEAGLVQISPASWSRRFTQKSYRTAFQILGSDDAGLAVAADYLVRELQLRRVFILDDGAYLGTSMADYLSAHVKAAGGEIVYRMSVNGKTSDFNAPLQKAQQVKPDLIFFSGRVIQSGVLARNLQRFQMSTKLLITGTVVTDNFLQNVEKIDSTVMAIVPSTPLEKRPGMAALQKKYAERFNAEMLPFAAYAYDSVHLLIAAAKKANSLDRGKLIDTLHDMKYNGVTGPIAFDANGALLKPSYTLYGLEQQKWVPLRVFTAK
ncbi:branched-chain amino acid ABC transporter substrate-binding protein [Herbaspirillum rhizosphaerae]|uniref:branched-chain amino acid ABC transporter substrate-binding protein n=1 Tax=Herbaspirillum rhizosphaerae TaxID=346179 RepID=UPI001F0A8AA5|nr:branched-chain amino acid ABC transporter substrate-binding protein [Herbaspirillum rhizosphaerae]